MRPGWFDHGMREQQGAEARGLVSVTLRAVRHYQNVHEDELPPDN